MKRLQAWWLRMAPASRHVLVLAVALVGLLFVERAREQNQFTEIGQDYGALLAALDTTVDGDITAGLQWERLEDTQLDVLTHDGARFVGAAATTAGDGRGVDLWTSPDGREWDTRSVSLPEVGPVGAVRSVHGAGDLIVMVVDTFVPAPGVAMRDSVVQRTVASDDGGVTWSVSETDAFPAPPVTHATFRAPTLQVAVHDGHIYAVATFTATIDVRDVVPVAYSADAECVFSADRCPDGRGPLDAADALAETDLPAATIDLIADRGFVATVVHSDDLGASWQPIEEIERGRLATVAADDTAVVVMTDIDDGGRLLRGSVELGWTTLAAPAIEWIDYVASSGRRIYAYGFGSGDGEPIWAVLEPDGSWRPLVGPGTRTILLDPAIGPAGQIHTVLVEQSSGDLTIPVPAVAFRAEGGDWEEGLPLASAPDPSRFEYVVGRTTILGLVWPDLPDEDDAATQARIDLLGSTDATVDDFVSVYAAFGGRDVWVLTPTG